jgi:hypothetical protein
MIDVLFAAADVATGRLQVTIGVGTNPHIRPSWWNDQAANSLQVAAILQRLVLDVAVTKARRRADSAEAGTIVAGVPQACAAREVTRTYDGNTAGHSCNS